MQPFINEGELSTAPIMDEEKKRDGVSETGQKDAGGLNFVADAMLGKLAKWLRLLGYDTHYQGIYEPGDIYQLVKMDRRLISRNKDVTERFADAVLIHSEKVGSQLVELKERLSLMPNRSIWFSRCLICNVPLEKPQTQEALESVPEYIFYKKASSIRRCPSCGRFYWPGSHRTKMLHQLERWGL